MFGFLITKYVTLSPLHLEEQLLMLLGSSGSLSDHYISNGIILYRVRKTEKPGSRLVRTLLMPSSMLNLIKILPT